MTEPAEPTRVVPYLSLNGRAREAIETWARAFGASEKMAFPEQDGRIRHAEVEINGGPVFLTDFNMDPVDAFEPTRSISLHLAVPDGGDWMKRAEAAGCQVITPWQKMPFGGYGRLVDPFGVIWAIASPDDLNT
jgi:PhnB protein